MRETQRRLDAVERKANAQSGKLHKLTIRYDTDSCQDETTRLVPGLEHDTVIIVRERHDYLGENEKL